jgi:hypothetical protein
MPSLAYLQDAIPIPIIPGVRQLDIISAISVSNLMLHGTISAAMVASM